MAMVPFQAPDTQDAPPYQWEGRFPPVINDMMKYCVLESKLNRRGGKVKLKNCKTSAPSHKGESYCDRMTVSVPYCGTYINVEVLFDYRKPSQPPDIVLSESDFNPNLENLTILSEWKADNPAMLSMLLEQLLREFVHFCASDIARYQRLQFEYHTLDSSDEYSDVEVFLLPKEEKTSGDPEALFYIPLYPQQLGLAHLAEIYADEEIALIVKLSPPNASQAKTTIIVSPKLDKALGNLSKTALPTWGADCSPCLMDYVPLVHSALKDKVKSITRTTEIRKEFIFTWLSLYEGAVLEYDMEKYSFVSFLFEVKGFSIIVHFSITKAFPIEAPIIKLRSVYHKLDGYPFEMVSRNYDFSSQWTAVEMMERTRKHLMEIIPKFKENSLKKGELLT